VLVAGVVRAGVERLRAIAAPDPGIVPGALKAMGKKEVFEIGAGFQREILLAADTAVGQLLVALRVSKARDRRIGAAVGTAHDELQDAVAYLGHGGFPPEIILSLPKENYLNVIFV